MKMYDSDAKQGGIAPNIEYAIIFLWEHSSHVIARMVLLQSARLAKPNKAIKSTISLLNLMFAENYT